MKTTSSTFWTRAKRFPPILVRLLARRQRYDRPMTDEEIAERSGLDLYSVKAIYWSTDWSCCSLPAMHCYLVACGIDFENREQMQRIYKYLKRNPTWKSLRVSPHWKSLYEPLLRRYRESVTTESKVTKSQV